jgi:4-alpha-glucanotransferase
VLAGLEMDRRSGLLLHLTSLPGDFGIGDMGPSAYEFVDFLGVAAAKWQLWRRAFASFDRKRDGK